jgi:HD-GYP domain-containing protein (c-di-GMP phosphodiesterase class II)
MVQDAPDPTQVELLRQWAESIEAKDLYTASHCARVASFTEQLATAMGLEGVGVGGGRDWLGTGSMMHDVGKLAVPASILNKPGPLDAEELRIMQMHTVWGDELISKLELPPIVRSIVRHHHERWDGTGYPDRLVERAIPLAARILNVVDVYDALTSDRSYRPAMSRDDALAIMQRESGRGLDPTIFRTFRRVIMGDTRAQVRLK